MNSLQFNFAAAIKRILIAGLAGGLLTGSAAFALSGEAAIPRNELDRRVTSLEQRVNQMSSGLSERTGTYKATAGKDMRDQEAWSWKKYWENQSKFGN